MGCSSSFPCIQISPEFMAKAGGLHCTFRRSAGRPAASVIQASMHPGVRRRAGRGQGVDDVGDAHSTTG